MQNLITYIETQSKQSDSKSDSKNQHQHEHKYLYLLQRIKQLNEQLTNYHSCAQDIKGAYANPKDEIILLAAFNHSLCNAMCMNECYKLCIECSDTIKQCAAGVFEFHKVANIMVFKSDGNGSGNNKSNNNRNNGSGNNGSSEGSENDHTKNHTHAIELNNPNTTTNNTNNASGKYNHHPNNTNTNDTNTNDTNTNDVTADVHIKLSVMCVCIEFLIDFDMLKVSWS